MLDVISALPNLATLVFAVSSMLSVGLSYTLADIVGPLRRARRVVRALVANFLLVPLLAYFIARLLALDDSLAVGLILIGTAAGAPFLIKLTSAAAGDVALSATLLVLLLPATIVYMPLAVPLLVPGARVNAGAIAAPLVLALLLPLVIGLLIRARALHWAQRLQPILSKTATYSLVLLVVFTVLANLPEILNVTMRAVLAAALFTIAGFGVGYVLGGANPDAREVLGLGTAQRNIAASTVVATQGFASPDTLVMVIATSLVGLAILFPIASKLREGEIQRAEMAARGVVRPGWVSERLGARARRARVWAITKLRRRGAARAGGRVSERRREGGPRPGDKREHTDQAPSGERDQPK